MDQREAKVDTKYKTMDKKVKMVARLLPHKSEEQVKRATK